jgi:hypothetical protein
LVKSEKVTVKKIREKGGEMHVILNPITLIIKIFTVKKYVSFTKLLGEGECI